MWLTSVSCGAAIAHQKTGDPISLDGKSVRYALFDVDGGAAPLLAHARRLASLLKTTAFMSQSPNVETR